jgi:hypothetical protein
MKTLNALRRSRVGGSAYERRVGRRANVDIYWVDVEGGAATLVISPSGESLLYDAGWENDDRDARRSSRPRELPV